MAYIVNNTVGVAIATIADGTIDSTSTSLTLIGKGFNGYGKIVAEEWVHMIEHFTSPTAPDNAIKGQLWFDSTVGKLKTNKSNIFGSPEWEEVTQTIVEATEPTPSSHDYGAGSLWFNSTNKLLSISTDGVTWDFVKTTKTGTGGEPPVGNSEIGDLFYDQDTKELKVLSPDLHGAAAIGWDVVGPARYKGTVPPVAPKDGDEWWDSDNKQLHMFDEDEGLYRLIGPSTSSGFSPTVIGLGLETGSFPIDIDNKALLAIVDDDNLVGIWSKDDFIPAAPIRELVASGTGNITIGIPNVVVGPVRQWDFHNASDSGSELKIERGLNLSTIVGVDTEPTVLHGVATRALYSGISNNTPPVWQTSNASPLAIVDEGSAVNVSVLATDADAGPLSLTYNVIIGVLPVGLNLSISSGAITGTTTTATTSPFTIRANDGLDVADREFQIIVNQSTFNITNSILLNDDDSSVLSRTPSSTSSTTTWTISCWLKRGNLGLQQNIFSANNGLDNVHTGALIRPDGEITFAFGGAPGAGLHGDLKTTALFRDPSAWYHMVFVADVTNATTSDRMRIYVNGVRITDFVDEELPNQNLATGHWNTNTKIHRIGAGPGGIQFWDGYMSEINHIDGQALTPSSFGQFNTNGDWQPIDTSGLTFGTNGFHMDFAVAPGTGNGAGTDVSGEGNHFTDSGLIASDQVSDTPAVNYCVPLSNAPTFQALGVPVYSNGNLTTSVPSSESKSPMSMLVSEGKFYWEATNVTQGSWGHFWGIVEAAPGVPNFMGDVNVNAFNGLFANNSNTAVTGGGAGFSSGLSSGDVIGFKLDMDSGTFEMLVNNVSQGTQATGLTGLWGPLLGMNNASGDIDWRFGQTGFTFTIPVGYTELNTSNLPTPAIADPGLFFNPVIYTGNGTSQSITDLGFQPDFVWLKNRDQAFAHHLHDSVRGAALRLVSNSTEVEVGVDSVTSFDADGFTVGTSVNANAGGDSIVAWNWKEGATPGFDIVSYTGTGVARTLAHNLGAVPKFMIVKNRDVISNWRVYHGDRGATKHINLDQNAVEVTSTTTWNDTEPTSSVFTVGTEADTNANAQNIIAYLWSEIEGFSKFGSYTGNGSTDGPFVYCGFRPAFVMIREAAGSVGNWRIADAVRNTSNPILKSLSPNEPSNETASGDKNIDFLAAGFKLRINDTDVNQNSSTMIFAAFAESPFKSARAR